MGKKVEVIAGMIDGLDHIEAEIAFMSEACIGISKQDYAIDNDASFGMKCFSMRLEIKLPSLKKRSLKCSMRKSKQRKYRNKNSMEKNEEGNHERKF